MNNHLTDYLLFFWLTLYVLYEGVPYDVLFPFKE